jgi:hypothetical protein
LLLEVDRDLAAEVKAGCCELCGGALHVSNFERKPRGALVVVEGGDLLTRFSFCCATEGCRQRATPPSVRFLGRKVFWGAVVVLATAMQHGINAWRLNRLRELFGCSRRTLKRWRGWWLERFAASGFWKQSRGLFARPVDETTLPLSVFEAFAVGSRDAMTSLLRTLRFLVPVTTATGPGAMAF